MIVHHPEQKLGKKIALIVGAGFGGLNAAKALSRNPKLHVILIDQKNHHLFQPLLYQVATAGLNPADIAVPIRGQFADVENIEIHLGRARDIQIQTQTLGFFETDLRLAYDYLILACGSQHSYFGHDDWEQLAPGLKTLEQATEIRRRILSAFENAENETDLRKQKNYLNFVVVGGGPTGVELAGAIADISRNVLVRDFQRINPSQAKVILVEAGPRVLAAFSESLSTKACEALMSLGVEVRTSSRVEKITENGVQIGHEFLPSKTVLWAAGVEARKIAADQPIETDRAGRIRVNADLSLPIAGNIFAIGDMAAASMADGQMVPGLAPAAIQMGQHIAKVIAADLKNHPRPPFKYRNKGLLATIGKAHAIMEIGKIKISGRIAWFAWLFIHVFYLVGFKNRFSVMLYWFWSYVFSKRGARLITDRNWKLSGSDSP